MKKTELIAGVFLLTFLSGCMRYYTHNRDEVLLEGIDIDETLRVADITMAEDRWGSVLTVWAIRDQVLTPDQARTVSQLYFDHVDRLRRNFNIWHLTWAIANMYRHGNTEVRSAMQSAYEDALRRARELGGIAETHADDDELHMGDAHAGGRAYARKHLVVPGTEGYLQSFDEYLATRRRRDEDTTSGDGGVEDGDG